MRLVGVRYGGWAMLLGAMFVARAAALEWHVSPQGKDVASGTSSEPMTLEAALKAARQKGAGEARTIWLRGGTYELSAPVVLMHEDSRLSISAYKDEKPILSGGRRITGWKPVADAAGVWEAEVPGWYFRSLFVNGRRATLARTPNAGSFFKMQGERLSDKPVQFKFAKGDIKAHWAREPDAVVVGFEKWTDFRRHIRAFAPEDNVVRLSGDAGSHTHESGARYFVENTADSLDAPGEWRVDRVTERVRYWPLEGEDMGRAEVVAPRLSGVMGVKGDLEGKKPVREIVLRGITFSHTDWELPPDGYTDSQAAVRVPGDLRAEAAIDCTIEDCMFSHLGGYAIDLGRGCQRWKIIANDISDIAAGGIRVGVSGDKSPDGFSANHSHTITDNHLHGLGRVNSPAVGVLILQSGTNRLAHNHIHDLYYTAVSVGWNWGYQETPCRENVIEFNHLHNIGQAMLSDMGAVYTLGIQRGTVVRNNLIHDVNSFTYGGWGLYPDEGSTGIVFENNVVYRTKSAGFHQHYGRENIVRNNIFAFGKEHQVMRTREEEHVSFFFTNNIVYFDSGTLLGSSWKNDRYVMENNVYFDARRDAEPLKFSGASLEEWRQRGHDTNSMVADPLFVALDTADFRLRPDSPALARGFHPVDLKGIGVRRNRPKAP